MKFWLVLLFVLAPRAWPYPEMIRHGYTNCTACHISPTGGGALTAYGDSLARELLSYQWKSQAEKENPEDEPKPRRFHLGGEIRVLSLYLNNQHETSRKWIPMQVHGEASYNDEFFAANLRLGLVAKPDGGSEEEEADESDEGGGFGDGFSGQVATAYVMARYAEIWNLRLGRFLPGYGLNNSMHFLGTRGGLGFGFKDQRTGLEISRLGERWGAVVAIFGARDENQGENSRLFQFQYSPTDKSKVALNFWNEDPLRNIFGVWAVTPLYGSAYLSFDLNRQRELDLKTTGHYYFVQLGYEMTQGVQARLLWDRQQRDETRSYTKVVRYGPSIQIFPSPYFDLELAWLKEHNRLYNSSQGDYAYILLHGYY